MENLKFRVNPLFLLVFLLFAVVGMAQELLVALILVVIHELAHVLVALREGFSVQKIEIFPFGGMAEYGGVLALNPGAEIRVALAGPLLNLLLSPLFWFLGWDLFLFYSLLLAGFNLLPALPLDGGRVLRALLVKYCGFQTGTTRAVKVAYYLAGIGFLAGILTLYFQGASIFILFISFFVYGAAVREQQQYLYKFFTYLTRREEYLAEIRSQKVAVSVIKDDLCLREVIALLRPDKFNLYYVLNGKCRVISVLGEHTVLEAFFTRKNDVSEPTIQDIIEE